MTLNDLVGLCAWMGASPGSGFLFGIPAPGVCVNRTHVVGCKWLRSRATCSQYNDKDIQTAPLKLTSAGAPNHKDWATVH